MSWLSDRVANAGLALWLGSRTAPAGEVLYADARSSRELAAPALVSEVVLTTALPDLQQDAASARGIQKQHLRVVCLSDTHERHLSIDVPPGDVLIVAGDLLAMNRHFSTAFSVKKLKGACSGFFF
jgi:hypothetical protein